MSYASLCMAMHGYAWLCMAVHGYACSSAAPDLLIPQANDPADVTGTQLRHEILESKFEFQIGWSHHHIHSHPFFLLILSDMCAL